MPDYFLGQHPSIGNHGTVWTFDNGYAVRVDVVGQRNEVISGTPPNVVVKDLPDWTFTKLKLALGEYHRRIARRSSGHMHETPGFESLRAAIELSNGQLIALTNQLERICRVVHPDDAGTLDVYGHEIRNLLILAATEVETHWKGILTANGARANNTLDYVKLSAPLQLPAYEVALPYYPWLAPVRPFANWQPSSTPSRDLPWYDSYNAVKHDRELNFPRATLRNAFHAICGNYVMLCAQFGMPNYWCRRRELHSFFQIRLAPQWDPSDTYTREQGQSWTPVNYPF